MSWKIGGVQALRGLAILMVAIFHFTTRYATSTPGQSNPYPYGNFFAPWASLLNQGKLGVELFFMISGFVISLTLSRSKNFKNFALKRFVRLWPALVIALPIVWVGLQFTPGFEASSRRLIDLLWSFTLVNPSVAFGLSGGAISLNFTTGVLWSLSVEIMFYLLAAATYFYTSNFLRSQIAIAVALLPLAILAYQPIWPTNAPMLAALTPLIQLADNYFWFLGGIAVFVIRFQSGGPKIWVLFASCWLATCITAWAHGVANLPWFLLVNTLIFAVFASVAFENQMWLKAKPLASLGDISYEYYLIHEAFGISLLQLVGQQVGLNSPLLALLPMVLAVPIAFCLKRYWSDFVGKKCSELLRTTPTGQLEPNHNQHHNQA